MIGTFQRLSIRKKLTFVMLLTSLAAVLLSSGTMFAYHAIYLKRSLMRELRQDAEIVSEAIGAAMAFKDKFAADRILNLLQRRPQVLRATVFDSSGDFFAEYTSEGAHGRELPPVGAKTGAYQQQACYLSLAHPISLEGDVVGSISILCCLREQQTKVKVSGLIMLAALVVSTGMAMILSLKLQRLISDPLLQLASLAERVTVQRDYSLRARTVAKDETGTLVEVFNGMLSEIQKRDLELRTSEQRFRQIAETIQEVFWIVDVASRRVLYVSPAYEKIWGRSCADLYANQEEWFNTVHPDDRERFLISYLRDFTSNFDEEYRITRPDGAIRWIHMRGFPIADEGGQVYRVVGISEDITLRKQLEKEILEISDREQSRFGQDLHDSLCQHLVRIGFAANVLQSELHQQEHPQSSRAKKIAELVDQAISQARNLARGLYPVKLETKGLRSALEELAASVNEDHGIDCRVECDEDLEINDYAVAIHLYRICQEAVTNAVKHAAASRVIIRFSMYQHRLVVAISDDGVGIASGGGGMGLNIMNYRARMLGATLEITSNQSRGTIVTCAMHFPSNNPGEIVNDWQLNERNTDENRDHLSDPVGG